MKPWYHKIRKYVVAALISLGVLVLSYVVNNSSIPRPDELKVLRIVDGWKSLNGRAHDNVPDSLLFINVCYDKQLVDYYEEGFHVGHYAITDRGKLLQLLTKAHETDSYRYIMLDVIFEHGMSSPYDSALFALIEQMPRIVVAAHHNTALQDDALWSKAGLADYTTTYKDSDFSLFQFRRDSLLSMPLRMYQELTGRDIRRHGILYADGGHLCRNSITLQQPIRMNGVFHDHDSLLREKNFLYLDADLLAIDSLVPVVDQMHGKIVVVGDFNSDRHNTYVGSQPGSVICINAYNALCRHNHYINWWFVSFLFLFYAAIVVFRINGWSLPQLVRWVPLRMLLQLLSVPTLMLLVALVAYLCGIVYNFYVATIIYWAGGALYNLLKHTTNEITTT